MSLQGLWSAEFGICFQNKQASYTIEAASSWEQEKNMNGLGIYNPRQDAIYASTSTLNHHKSGYLSTSYVAARLG
jgi:hypothetical protein